MSGEEHLKRMTELLRSGATMLEDHCPECNSPLFRIKREVWCPRCNKRVITVKEETFMAMSSLRGEVERSILLKIQESSKMIMVEKDVEKLEKLSGLLVKLLEALEKVRSIS